MDRVAKALRDRKDKPECEAIAIGELKHLWREGTQAVPAALPPWRRSKPSRGLIWFASKPESLPDTENIPK